MTIKLFKSINRALHKKRILKKILHTEQSNRDVVNIHRMDKKNVGDYYCAPHHYFDVLKNKGLDIFDYKINDPLVAQNFIDQVSNNALIIGGGGLLNRSAFSKQMKLFESLSKQNKKVVLWGVGHNSKDPKSFGNIKEYNVNISSFGLAGTRDFSMPGEFVPCVSCLHPLFDSSYEELQDIGVIFHKKTLKRPEILKKFRAFPSTSNTTELEPLLQFIGSSNKIITDSYHAMYWSMLMGKKVAVVPNSSKFFDFKHPPVITTFDKALESVNSAQTYDGLLEECREINHTFAEKVFDYLNL